jgi:glutamine amidotransferase
MNTAIVIDYGVGNSNAIANMLQYIGVHTKIGSDAGDIRDASLLVLPGVGSFDHGMRALTSLHSFSVIEDQVLNSGVPCLGICLGMQMFFESSEEGDSPGLCWIPGHSRRITATSGEKIRLPHMGWSPINIVRETPLFGPGIPSPFFYFVHSYAVSCRNKEHVIATTEYHSNITAAVKQDNIVGVQFHPEKSHRYGLAFFRALTEWAFSTRTKQFRQSQP